MTELEINRTIHEAMGKCWHKQPDNLTHCLKCDLSLTHCLWCGLNLDFSKLVSYTRQWSDYGPMLEWAMRQDWWEEFLNTIDIGSAPMYPLLLNPLTGSTAIAKFLKEKKSCVAHKQSR